MSFFYNLFHLFIYSLKGYISSLEDELLGWMDENDSLVGIVMELLALDIYILTSQAYFTLLPTFRWADTIHLTSNPRKDLKHLLISYEIYL